MTTYYTATFPNGAVLKRATASRKYTHAWFACGTRLPGDWADRYGATWSVTGFSGSEALARGALASRLGHSPGRLHDRLQWHRAHGRGRPQGLQGDGRACRPGDAPR